jgi:TPR repeat protein
VQNHPVAPLSRGICSQYGSVVETSYEMEMNYYRHSAEQGCTAALVRLDHCMFEGLGLEQNMTGAVALFERAAAAKNSSGQASLKECFMNGWGT